MRALAIALVVLGALGAARAQPGNAADDAKVLFDQGRELVHGGDFAAACEKFTRSFELEPEAGTEINLADCHDHLGHAAKAWHLFDDAAAKWHRAHDPREKFARDHADAIVPRLGTLVVRVPDPDRRGLTITIGGQAVVLAAEIRELVDPGPVEVVASTEGRPPFSASAKPAAGQTVTIDVPADRPPVEPTPTPTSVPAGRTKRLVLAAGLGVVGVTVVTVATVLAFQAKSDYDSVIATGACKGSPVMCTSVPAYNKLVDDNNRANTASYVWAAGAVIAAAGVVVYLTAPHAVAVSPTASASSAGIAVSGRF